MDGCKPPQKGSLWLRSLCCFHGVLVELFFCQRASVVITGEHELSPPHIPFLLADSLAVQVYVFIRGSQKQIDEKDEEAVVEVLKSKKPVVVCHLLQTFPQIIWHSQI
ncbi:hypothetical protein IHE45_20G091000 [Dioscorea alata]|uniref:Uncharacterized protein n=1 Tax=Dioscorea alata TaxID=55571 RepID=A0ACB7TU03_DIOAL|nr:hypothetical protein IHE45_20G091000 [Dioscorea alata]